MAVIYIFAVMLAACAFGQAMQTGAPAFRAEDVRPHGAAEPHPLVPGMLAWIFGSRLGAGCTAGNIMDPATYKTELCGTRVLVGGIEARLIYAAENQINLVLPEHPWEDELVGFQVIRAGVASPVVPVRFGFNRPVISLAAPASAGLPVWVRVEKPWGKGTLRYPFHLEPWDLGPGWFDIRFEGKALPPVPLPYLAPNIEGSIGLPRETPSRYLHRVPLHLLYRLDRPGTYQVRYTEYRHGPGSGVKTVYQQSRWTPIEILPSTSEQRDAWFRGIAQRPPDEPVELLADYLPSLLVARDEPALRLLARYLDHPDSLVRRYAGYALNYFDPDLRKRVVPGREPLRMLKR